MNPKRIRLSDIAKEADVSTMAVSHVLNGSGKGKVSVSPHLAKHIREVAQKLNYRPHQAARALRGSPIKVIGAICYGAINPITTRALACLHFSAESHSFHLMSSRLSLNSSDWKDSIVAQLSHGVNALVAFCEEDRHVEEALQLGLDEGVRVIPVRLDGGSLGNKGYGIRTDLRSGIELALAQFDDSKPIHVVSEKLDPYWSAILEDYTSDITCNHVDDYSISIGDQILTTNDLEAANLIRKHDHLTAGLDYKIIGWGNAPACVYMHPQLTSIGLNLNDLADAAVDSIVANETPRHHHIKPILLSR